MQSINSKNYEQQRNTARRHDRTDSTLGKLQKGVHVHTTKKGLDVLVLPDKPGKLPTISNTHSREAGGFCFSIGTGLAVAELAGSTGVSLSKAGPACNIPLRRFNIGELLRCAT